MFMLHSHEDPENSKHCEITIAILGRASGQTDLIKRLINSHFFKCSGPSPFSFVSLRGSSERLESLGQLPRHALAPAPPQTGESHHTTHLEAGYRGSPTGSGHPMEPTPFLLALPMLVCVWRSWCLHVQQAASGLTQAWQYGCPSSSW